MPCHSAHRSGPGGCDRPIGAGRSRSRDRGSPAGRARQSGAGSPEAGRSTVEPRADEHRRPLPRRGEARLGGRMRPALATVARSSRSPARSRAVASRAAGWRWTSARRSLASPTSIVASRLSRAARPRRPTPADDLAHLGPVRHDELGGGRRRRRPHVGGEVGQGHVGLVPDPGDDGPAVGDDRPHDGLLVERPQVVERAAAAGEDRHRRDVVGRAGCSAGGRPAASRISAQRSSRPSARAMLAAAPSPWTRHGDTTIRASGQRRSSTRAMSWRTAPLGLVTTPMTAGRTGSGRFRAGLEQALRRELRLERLEPDGEIAEAGGLDGTHVELVHAARLEDVESPMGHDSQTDPGVERRGHPVVAEPDARQLAAVVLEAEVAVPGARDRHPADLALDPDVAQPLIATDRVADRAGDVAHGEDAERRRSYRRDARGLDTGGRAAWLERPRGVASVRSASQAGRAQSGGSFGSVIGSPHSPHRSRFRRGSGSPLSGCRPGSCRPRSRRSGPGRRGRCRSWRACEHRSGCRRRSQVRSRRP